jgi:Flp pilus assembly protein TadD
MSVKIVRFISVSFKQLLLLISIILTIYGFSAAAEKTSSDPDKKLQFAPQAEKGADELFKEAAIVAGKNPEDAIRLYRRALQSKPDAWAERQKLAALYEKTGKLDAASSEYETVNNAVDSARSNTDLTKILIKREVLTAAASTALHGAQKFPDDITLAHYAGDLLLKTGQTEKAFEVIKRASLNKPDDKEMMFLLGRAYENMGDGAAALTAYLKSVGSDIKSDAHVKAFQRLEKSAVRVDDLWFFLPKGWERDGKTLMNTLEARRIHVEAHVSTDMNAVALKVVKERMPAGMFDAERLKEYEELRKMANEISKTTPDAPKEIMTARLPLFQTKPLEGKTKGLIAVASSGEEPSEFMQSVCALVLPRANKTYTVTLVTSKQYRDAEKALLSLIDYIVLPL